MKFEVGQQWKCRDGSRAVVVRMYGDGTFDAWHANRDETFRHCENGKYSGACAKSKDLISPWHAREFEVWVNVWEDTVTGEILKDVWDTKQFSDRDAATSFSTKSHKLLARGKLTLKEGEGI